MSRNLLTINQFADKYPAFSVGGLRWTRFNSNHNGFKAAFVKHGARVLIDEDQFFKAIEEQDLEGTAPHNA
jgi:hypothetical protein